MLRTISAALALIALAACSPPKDLVFHGELSYDTEIILPPDAKAHVEVRAKPDEFSPAIVIGQTDAPAPGSPIPFTVTVPGKDIPKDVTSFAVIAQIKEGDRYYFISGSDTTVSAETQDQPLDIHLIYSAPAPVSYKCGPEWFSVAFDTEFAQVTAENQVKGTKVPLVRPGPGGGKLQYSNAMYTFIKDGPNVSFGYAKKAPEPCIVGKP